MPVSRARAQPRLNSCLSTAPDDARPFHAFVGECPHEVLLHLAEHLDARSLLHLHEATSSGVRLHPELRGMAKLAVSRRLWTARLQTDFELDFLQRNMPEARLAPKDAYLRHREVWVVEERERRLAREAEARRQERLAAHREMQACYTIPTTMLHLFQETCLTCAFFPLIAAFSVLLAMQLDAGDDVTLATWEPLLALVGMVAIGLCCMCYVQKADHPVPFRDDTWANSDGAIKAMMRPFEDAPARNSASACLYLLLLAGQIVILALRTTGEIDWSWPVVFTPFFTAAGVTILFPLFFRFHRNERICIVLVLVFVAPLSSMVGPLVARLEGEDIKVSELLIPIWMLLFAFAALSCFICVADGSEEPLVIWCGAASPWLVFTILVACYYDLGDHGGISYITMFIPLWIFLCGFTIAGCIAGELLRRDRLGGPNLCELLADIIVGVLTCFCYPFRICYEWWDERFYCCDPN